MISYNKERERLRSIMLRIELISIVILCTSYISYYAYTRLKYKWFELILLITACISLPSALIVSLTPTVSINDYVRAYENDYNANGYMSRNKEPKQNKMDTIISDAEAVQSGIDNNNEVLRIGNNVLDLHQQLGVVAFNFLILLLSIVLMSFISRLAANVCKGLAEIRGMEIMIIVSNGFFLLLAQYVIFSMLSSKYAIIWYALFIGFVWYRIAKVSKHEQIEE